MQKALKEHDFVICEFSQRELKSKAKQKVKRPKWYIKIISCDDDGMLEVTEIYQKD